VSAALVLCLAVGVGPWDGPYYQKQKHGHSVNRAVIVLPHYYYPRYYRNPRPVVVNYSVNVTVNRNTRTVTQLERSELLSAESAVNDLKWKWKAADKQDKQEAYRRYRELKEELDELRAKIGKHLQGAY
jgi:hypothetical protein